MAECVKKNVLLLTDDSELTRSVLQLLASLGVRGLVVDDSDAAVSKCRSLHTDMVLADLQSLQERNVEFLRRIKAHVPEVPIVMFSDAGSISAAAKLVREGCTELLAKPADPDKLRQTLERFLATREIPLAAAATDGAHCLYEIAGNSASLRDLIETASKLSPTSVPVLLTGESGTGKELLAHFLHRHSNRARGPYIKVNCAALSESLLESELFGHERGAFTGAHSQHKGKFERAHGGTLLLDEISETGPRLQAELLRVLEQQDFERVGGDESISVNVRVICTSNLNLAAEVKKGNFRRDLYYRITGAILRVPPLRERMEDLPTLVWHFVNKHSNEAGRQITRLDTGMMKAFAHYHWPGNVRELRNVVRRALIFGAGTRLNLPESCQAFGEGGRVLSHGGQEMVSLSLQDVERDAILEALRRTNRHQAKAAKLLGITDRTLREKLRRYRQEGYMQEKEEITC